MKTLAHYMLALGMLVTGSLNTLSTKAADQQLSSGRPNDGYTPGPREFNHPFFQACGMFMGEFLCLFAFRAMVINAKRTKSKPVPRGKPFNRLLLCLPAMCDMTGTSLMYVGLTLTYASIFQMLRGCVVIFTGVFSVLFLKRKIKPFRWAGMSLVLIGTVLVGISSEVCPVGNSSSAPNPTVGNILIIIAQLIVAVQMVIEEKFISGYDIPALQVVGWEGFWGFTILSSLVAIMYWIPRPDVLVVSGASPCHFEDAIDAVTQMANNWKLWFFVLGNILSIAFYNYFGISVTKHLNAATRMVLDSMRTVVIWAVTLSIGWQDFCYMQCIGFAVLLAGTFVYNDIHPAIRLPGFNYDEETTEVKDELELLDSNEALISKQYKAAYNNSLNSEGYGQESPMFTTQNVFNTPTLGRMTAVKQR